VAYHGQADLVETGTRPSNSGFWVEKSEKWGGDWSLNVVATIDRLTILADRCEGLERLLQRSLYVESYRPTEGTYKHRLMMVDGSLVEYGVRKRVAGHVEEREDDDGLGGISKVWVPDEDVSIPPDVRIDFNPNKCMWEGMDEILGQVCNPRLSRIDVAIDYRDVDLSGYQVLDSKGRKRNVWQDGTGRVETVYIGSPSSDFRVRIYDKAREQKVPGIWWRVEAQCRCDLEELGDPFDGLVIVRQGGEGLKFTDKAVLYYLSRFPSAWGELSKHQRYKYRDLAEQWDALSPSPSEVWESEKARLLAEVSGVLGRCADAVIV
jgi:hypothetical protein